MLVVFGFVLFLFYEGFERNRIRKYLFVFVLVVSVLVVFIYVILS